MDTIEATPDEIKEAITHLARTASRLPAHWIDRHDALHQKINALLDELVGR